LLYDNVIEIRCISFNMHFISYFRILFSSIIYVNAEIKECGLEGISVCWKGY